VPDKNVGSSEQRPFELLAHLVHCK